MTSQYRTSVISFEGGLIQNLAPIEQGSQFPGSLVVAKNFEPAPKGGYRRISGYQKWDPSEVPGTGDILGVFVYRDEVVACRDKNIYSSTGSGWTLIHTQANDPVYYQGDTYNWGTGDKIILCDGANQPVTYDGTAVSTIADTAVLAATKAKSFNRHMHFTLNNELIFSAPSNETDFDPANGAGVINIGKLSNGLIIFRERLFILGIDHIHVLSGQTAADFVLETVTDRTGCIDPRTAREFNSDVYYAAQDGIRTIAGTERNDDLELSSVTRTIPALVEDLFVVDFSNKTATAVVSMRENQYRIFFSNSVAPRQSSRGMLGGLRLSSNGGLFTEWYEIEGIRAACSDSSTREVEDTVIHADYDGFVYKQFMGDSFDGNEIDAQMITASTPLDDPEIRKTLYTATFVIDEVGRADIGNTDVNPIFTYTYDAFRTTNSQPPAMQLGTGLAGASVYGSAVYGTSTYGTGKTTKERVNLRGSGEYVSFGFGSFDVKSPYAIRNMTVEYSLDGRQ